MSACCAHKCARILQRVLLVDPVSPPIIPMASGHMCGLQQVSICVFHGKLLTKPVFPQAESALPSLPVLLSSGW